jgi:hypothetical protein
MCKCVPDKIRFSFNGFEGNRFGRAMGKEKGGTVLNQPLALVTFSVTLRLGRSPHGRVFTGRLTSQELLMIIAITSMEALPVDSQLIHAGRGTADGAVPVDVRLLGAMLSSKKLPVAFAQVSGQVEALKVLAVLAASRNLDACSTFLNSGNESALSVGYVPDTSAKP